MEKVNPDLVARDDQGKAYTVRYEAVNAMLLNEFLKEHCRVEQLEAALARQKSEFQTGLAKQRNDQQEEITALRKALKEQAAQIQKVSARLQAGETSPRLIANLR